MSTLRTIGKWFFRLCLLVILLGALTWIGIHVKRAYYLRIAQQPPSAFIVENAPVIALTHVRVIDGTASPAQDGQTLILDHGTIVDLGPSSSVSVPSGRPRSRPLWQDRLSRSRHAPRTSIHHLSR